MAERTGRMAVVLPLGALFHAGADGTIRQKLLQADLVEGVISLGSNLFYGTGIPACILICSAPGAKSTAKAVYFVDALDLLVEQRNQNELSGNHVTTISRLWAAKQERDGRSRLVAHQELEENGWSLYPALYIWNDNALQYASKGTARPPISIREARDQLVQCMSYTRDAETRFRRVMKEGGWLS